jgi:hypothetical protein
LRLSQLARHSRELFEGILGMDLAIGERLGNLGGTLTDGNEKRLLPPLLLDQVVDRLDQIEDLDRVGFIDVEQRFQAAGVERVRRPQFLDHPAGLGCPSLSSYGRLARAIACSRT